MDAKEAREFVERQYETSVVPALFEFIKIPNVSPQFDEDYNTNGLVQKAVKLVVDWVESQKVPGLKLEVVHDEGMTPLIFITVDGDNDTDDTVLLYGHLDKQPPFVGWSEGLGPYEPVLRGDRLYGRGGADDGYSIFAAITAVRILKEQKLPHARLVIVIESCEESGSRDLMHYMDKKSAELGNVQLVVCLDSGCSNYEQMWMTTSLRGILLAELRVRILREGVHSGAASGIAPSSFRILRDILQRIEDSKTGEILIKEAYCDIPEQFVKQAEDAAATLGDSVWKSLPFVSGAGPVGKDCKDLLLNQTWRPALSVTGLEGAPPLATAGNVLRPETAVKLSLRLPPLADPEAVSRAMKEIVERDPPYGAEIVFNAERGNPGWMAPVLEPWLEKALEKASNAFFGKPARACGEGGSIPFMGLLGKKFPKAQFVITGVLGPGSNAHGPNEFLSISMAKGLTGCVASILVDHYSHFFGKK